VKRVVEEPSELEQMIGAMRKELWAFYGQYQGYQLKVLEVVNTGKAHAECKHRTKSIHFNENLVCHHQAIVIHFFKSPSLTVPTWQQYTFLRRFLICILDPVLVR
jgi:hypothetical protein